MPLIIPQPLNNSPLEKIAAAVSIYKALKGSPLDEEALKRAQLETQALEEARSTAARTKDAGSQESAAARKLYQGYGLQVGDQDTAAGLQDRFGKSSDYAQKKFESGLKSEADPFTARTKGLDLAIKQLDLQKKQQEMAGGSPKADFERLPIENQEQIKKLSGSAAAKKAIRDQLAATLDTLQNPQVPYEQKFMAAKNLGKTLNSTEGADAVGADEADRMLSFLSQLPTNRPGWDFGPQLDKFTDQVALKVRDIDQALVSTEGRIKGLYGRAAPDQGGTVPLPELMSARGGKSGSPLIPEAYAGAGSKPTAEDFRALEAAKARIQANPNDGVAKAALQVLSLKGLK